MSVDSSFTPVPAPRAPVAAMWICMILAWFFFIIPVPFTVFLAGPLNIAAFVLAIICLVRSRILHGVLGLIGTIVVSGICYMIGLTLTAAALAVGGGAMGQ